MNMHPASNDNSPFVPRPVDCTDASAFPEIAAARAHARKLRHDELRRQLVTSVREVGA